MKKYAHCFLVMAILFAGNAFAGTFLGDIYKDRGLLCERPVANFEKLKENKEASNSSACCIPQEYVAFSWGEDNCTRTVVPTRLCEFRTSEKSSVQFVFFDSFLGSCCEEDDDHKKVGAMNVNILISRAISDGGIANIIIKMKSEDRKRLGL